ncbi:non-ribosomal peptide synthetase [Plantactinospora sp. KBS50]|uniref:non-ribosomal peptide synthetase n=1 Tax=Plantactinospora sp. KBS50 TaxID=2024580 RepID=UPI0018DEF24A|nr:non-ribosomal peptide synthetase [Plantactinospora sp. KBS50]
MRDPLSGEQLNYGELWDRAGGLAAALVEVGVRRTDVVAVAQDRSVGLVVTLLGVLRAGAAYLPLDSMAPPTRLAGILQDAGAGVVVRSRSGGSLGLPPGLRVLNLDELGGGTTEVAGQTPDDPAYVAFTSGSTGRPKGVVVPHRAVRRLAVAPLFCTVEPGYRVGNGANPAFDATTFELWNTLTAGATVVVLPSLAELPLADWITLIRDERLDCLFLTTSLFHTVARERPDAFRALRTLVVGGEQLDIRAVRRVLAAEPPGRLVNGYGPTETTTFAAYFDCTRESLAGMDRVPIGFPLQETTLHVLNERNEPVPTGTFGELCVGGPGVALGYLHHPELTARRFVRLPDTRGFVYRTGDLARQLPSGAYEVAGRRDRQVKLRGFRIELDEIERATVATGLCDAAFVEKIGDGPAATLIGFVLPPAAGGPPSGELARELGRRLRDRLPAYMLPARWIALDRLPIGPTGKTDRAALLSLLDAAPTSAGEPAGPGDAGDVGAPVGTAVAAIWRDVLAVPRVAPEDNFVELGGNSILAMQVAARIRQNLGCRVEPADVLLTDTLAGLAARLEAASPAR